MKNPIKKYVVNYCFRKRNSHNSVSLDLDSFYKFDLNKIIVGNNSYGAINVRMYGGSYEKLILGNFCSIAPKTLFVLGGNHSTRCISTFPFKEKILFSKGNPASKGPIVVDDDVWIGIGSIVMSGVHIGQGAVVAAGAVVTKDVLPYAIVGGVPAKVIKYRYEPEMIEELLKIDYSKLTKEDIKKHIDDLYTELKDPSQLDWMPKKG